MISFLSAKLVTLSFPNYVVQQISLHRKEDLSIMILLRLYQFVFHLIEKVQMADQYVISVEFHHA